MSNFLTRRKFLQSTAAVATIPVLSACARNAKITETLANNMKPNNKYIQNGIANTCAHWGGLSVTVEDGKIVRSQNIFKGRVYNWLTDNTADLVYAKDRIQYPMVRKSFLENPKNPKPELRGSDSWVRVSWDKAIELAATQIKDAYNEKGPSSIFAGSHGWNSAGKLHAAERFVHRFFRCAGGYTSKSGNYSIGASMFITPYVTGRIDTFEKPSSWNTVLENSDVVVFWGANPTNTDKVEYGGGDGLLPEYHRKLKESKKRIIFIDPVYSESCKYFEVTKENWIAPRPNTDVAMIIGMAHTLYTAKKHDQAFLDEYTEGFEVFRDYFLGKEDGIVKDAKWAENITGVDAKTIKELALSFASNRTMLMSGWSIQRQHHGEQGHWAIITLASMLGQIGLPGGGFGVTFHFGATAGVPDRDIVALSGMGDKSKFEKEAPAISDIPVARVSDMLLNPGKTINYNGRKVTYPEIDLIYWAGGNPWSHHQDINTFFKGWSKVKTVIVNEMYWTSTARMADIVFPVTTPYERNDIAQAGGSIFPMKAIVPPQFEAKDDYEIFTLLAKKLRADVAKLFTENKSDMDWISQFYESARKQSLSKEQKLPSFRKFWEDGQAITFKMTKAGKNYTKYADFREDPLLNPLGTDSGKLEIFSKKVASYKYKDCPGHVTWMEPAEWLGMEEKPAPLALVTPHPAARLHSQQGNTSLRHTYEIQGREPLWINPEDAKQRGIKNGDLIELFNSRGSTLAGAVVTNRISKGVIRMQEGAWYDPLDRTQEKTLCKHGNVNTVTLDIPTSQLAVATSAQTCLADVRKYTEEVPKLTVFKQPKIVKL